MKGSWLRLSSAIYLFVLESWESEQKAFSLNENQKGLSCLVILGGPLTLKIGKANRLALPGLNIQGK